MSSPTRVDETLPTPHRHMIRQLTAYLRLARHAADSGGKPVREQLLDILSARFSKPSRLGISEYYDLALYDQSIDRERVKLFGGYRLIQEVRTRVNNHAWVCFNRDKLVFNLYARSVGAATADTRLAVTPRARATGSIRNVVVEEDVRAFLSDPSEYPLFAKPVFGAYGKGALALDALEEGATHVRVGREGVLPIDSVVARIMDMSRSHASRGCLLQRQLRQHPVISALAGPRVSGLRVGVVRSGRASVLYRAVMKVHAGDVVTDNFEHGRSGNLLADIDTASGAVTRAVQGVGLTMRTLTRHPTSGVPFDGFVVPEWPAVRELCLSMASALPELAVIGFDVAVSDTGPIVLEANTPGDFDLLQHAARKGVLEEPAFRALFSGHSPE